MVSVTQADDPIPRRDSPRTDLDPGVVALDRTVADVRAVEFRREASVALSVGDVVVYRLSVCGALLWAGYSDDGGS
jgi:hypothetical protein